MANADFHASWLISFPHLNRVNELQLRLILTEKAFREFFLNVRFKQERGIVVRIACCVGVLIFGRANV